jgi:preprotein translocase subunit YajC
MKIGKLMNGAAALLLSVSAVPALAQALTSGATVKDSQGGVVGSVTSSDDQYAVVKTDRNEVKFPVASFTKVDDGYLFGMTQAEVNAAADQAKAQAAQLISVGAVVTGPQGGSVGTIQELTDELVTIKLAGGEQLVRVPRAAVGASATGPVIGVTLAELQAQAGAAPAPEAEATPANGQ